jgi:hypothetical protein
MLGGSVSCGEGGRPAPTEPNKNQIDRRKVVVGALRAHWPLHHVSPNDCAAKAPRSGAAHRLFRRYDLVHGGPFGLCIIALLIGVV